MTSRDSEGDQPDASQQVGPQKRVGMLLTNGSRLTLSNFSISVGADGSVSSPMTPLLSLDMSPHWLEIAIDLLVDADAARAELLVLLAGTDDTLLGERLEAEAKAAMQAVAAAGIAIDAFYAQVKEFVTIPSKVQQAWRENGTARYKQMDEVFRHGFVYSPSDATRVRANLKFIVDVRGWVVHPAAKARDPARHPVVGVLTEWRLVFFRSENARLLVGEALRIIKTSLEAPRADVPKLAEFCGPALRRIQATVDRWVSIYGAIPDIPGR